MAHKLLEGLIDVLPLPGCEWPEPEREQWFDLLLDVLELLYPIDGEGIFAAPAQTPSELLAESPDPEDRFLAPFAEIGEREEQKKRDAVDLLEAHLAPAPVATPAGPQICPDCGKEFSVRPTYQARVDARKYRQWADLCTYCYADRARNEPARAARAERERQEALVPTPVATGPYADGASVLSIPPRVFNEGLRRLSGRVAQASPASLVAPLLMEPVPPLRLAVPVRGPAVPEPELDYRECPQCHNKWAIDPAKKRAPREDPELADYCFGCYKTAVTPVAERGRPRNPWRHDGKRRLGA